jgi:hypothetical protein
MPRLADALGRDDDEPAHAVALPRGHDGLHASGHEVFRSERVASSQRTDDDILAANRLGDGVAAPPSTGLPATT